MTQYIDGIAEIPQSRCIVSDDYRTITIPAKERTLGCVGDDETRRVWWDVPVENDGISLRGFELSIHYVNAAGHANRYDVATAYVVDNRVLFSWLVQRGAYEAAGLVNVSIKMRTLDGTDVVDEFNSAIAPFSVKDAQSYDAQPQPEQVDYIGAFIAQQSARIDAKIALADEAIADAQDATTAANTAAASATSAAQSASQAATAANSAATNASQAATDATDAAELAEQAAEGVESAIDAATAAATSANSAAATASTAAANADSKATLATQAASTANQAAQAAGSATAAANTAAGQATTAAGAANTAAGAANTAATNADAKAALADTAAANADTATANANTATTAATNAAQAANNAAEYAIDAADDMPKLIGTVDTAQTVNDAWPATPESAVLYGKSVQDGTPTPENPVPVQVVGGRNLLDPDNALYTVYNTYYGYPNQGAKTPISLPAGNYVLSTSNGSIAQGLYCSKFTDGTPTSIFTVYNRAVYAFTLSEPGTYTFNGYWANGRNDAELQLELGTTATPFTPYGSIGLQIGETVTPIDMHGHTLAGLQNYVRDELDIDAAGVKTIGQRVGVVDLGTLTWNYVSSGAYFYVIVANKAKGWNNLISTAYQLSDRAGVANLTNYHIVGGNNDTAIYVKNENYTDAAAFKVAMSGVLCYYELATPQTIELGTTEPPELTQPCELAFYASLDPEWVITYTQDPNVVISTLTGSIAPIEGATASTNYAVGAYLIHGNQLYRVTSAIATGETITPGSNCVACTVMGELVRLTA